MATGTLYSVYPHKTRAIIQPSAASHPYNVVFFPGEVNNGATTQGFGSDFRRPRFPAGHQSGTGSGRARRRNQFLHRLLRRGPHACDPKEGPERAKRNNALWVAEQLGIKLHIVDIVDEYKQVVFNPQYGYGANLNPCLGVCCFLTDRRYSVRLSDLWEARGERRYELDDIMLLKVGRHIRPAPHFKLIVVREEGEGNFMRGYRSQYSSLEITSHGGPLTLLDGIPTRTTLRSRPALWGATARGPRGGEHKA